MVKEKEAFLGSVAKVVDVFAIVLAFVCSYFVDVIIRDLYGLREMAFASDLTFSGLWYFTLNIFIVPLLSVPVWLTFLSFQGSYAHVRTRSYIKELEIILKAGVFAIIAIGSSIFLFKLTLTSRLFIGIDAILTICFLFVAKLVFYRFLDSMHRRGYNRVNLLIVGTGKRAKEFINVVKNHSKWGLHIVGLIDDEHGLFGQDVEGFRVLGRLQDIPFILHRKVIDRVIFVVPRLWLNRIDDAIRACEKEGISTSISMDLYDLNIAKVRQTDFSGFPLLDFETFSAQQWQLFLKRFLDIILSLLLFVVFSPVIAITMIAVKVSSRGPLLFKQTRSGLNGRQFTLYKFRTMIDGAEFKRRELEKMNEMDGPVFKIKKDPRITRVGRILRKLSIDELPQLINVLKGDMSIVGPRPPLPVEVDLYKVWQRRRLSLKPDLTCIWQVSGRNHIRFEKWMEMDLEYIDKWSLRLDFKILFKTVFVVLFGYGAS